MEYKFQNCCTMTKETILAMYRKSRNPLFTATAAVLCVYYVYLAVGNGVNGHFGWTLIDLLCALALGAFAYKLPNLQAGITYRKNQRVYGREVKYLTKFYDDKFVVDNLADQSSNKILYSKIRNIVEDEGHIFLMLEYKLIVVLDKTDFITGSSEECLQFLREKAVNVPKKKKK